MLTAHFADGTTRAGGPHDSGLAPAIWLDLLDATEAERAVAERGCGLRVPSREEISEIESSSRIHVEGESLYFNTPMATREGGALQISPLGLVIAPDRLLTVRFAPSKVFDAVAAAPAAPGQPLTGIAVFTTLLEAMVDRLADTLEHVGGELDAISHRIFRADAPQRHRGASNEAPLRATLRGIGRGGDTVSMIRDALLGLGRMLQFVTEKAPSWLAPEMQLRLRTALKDVGSLNDYGAQLTNKVQFLLDATLGFINIEQNNGIRVLTVVSLVGVPPTLIASIYGMNFKGMPELGWALGYPYALTLIVVSAVLPMLWFRYRGWM